MKQHAGTLVPFPAWEANPYLGMLSLAAEAAGWRIAGQKHVAGLVAELLRLGPGDVVHVHWTAPVTAGATSASDADARRVEFRDVLTQLRARGVVILWTVHNELAHDARYPDTERAIAADLASLSDAIIQLHEHTADFVRDSFELPSEKLRTIPHSSYFGVYEDGRDSHAARAFVGVGQQVPTVGFVGQLRPYKGVDALFRAADLVATELPDFTVLVAGRLAPRDAVDFMAALPKQARAILHTDYVEASDLWKWFRASDAIALPYRKVLNSGTVPLAATFDRACVVPNDTALAREFAAEPWVRSYQTSGDPDRALADAIIQLLGEHALASTQAGAYARRNQPYDMSRAYLALLTDTVREKREAGV